MKRFCCAATAFALCLGMLTPAMAAGSSVKVGGRYIPYNQKIEIGGGYITAVQDGADVRIRLEHVTLHDPMQITDDAVIELIGENTINAFSPAVDHWNLGEPALFADSIRFEGDGSLTARAAASEAEGWSRYYGYEVPGIRTDAGTVAFAEGCAASLNSVVLDSRGVLQVHGDVEVQNVADLRIFAADGSLVLPEGSTLTVPPEGEFVFPLEKITGTGSIINEGLLTCTSASWDGTGNLTGSGVVEVGGTYYTNSGDAIAFRQDRLDFTMPNGYRIDATLERDHYEFRPSAGANPARLILQDLHLNGEEMDPLLRVPDGTVIELRGTSDLYQNRSGGGSASTPAVISIEQVPGAQSELTIEGSGKLRVDGVSSLAGDTVVKLRGDAEVELRTEYARAGGIYQLRGQSSLTARNLWCILLDAEEQSRVRVHSSGDVGIYSMDSVMVGDNAQIESFGMVSAVISRKEITAETPKYIHFSVPDGGWQTTGTVFEETLWSALPPWESALNLERDRRDNLRGNAARRVVLSAAVRADPPSGNGGGAIAPESNTDRDPITGTVTETVINPDGSRTTVITRKDGTVSETVSDASGHTAIRVTIPEKVSQEATQNGTFVEVELPALDVSGTDAENPEIVFDCGKIRGVSVRIPVGSSASGNVAVRIDEGPVMKVIRKSVIGDGWAYIPLEETCRVKIVSRAVPFDDISPEHWASGPVDFVSSHELFNGTGQGKFSPALNMTRSMLVKVLHNLENNPEPSSVNRFPDVENGTWYTSAVLWATEHGVVKGYDSGAFGPEDNITREQLAVMLYRYVGSPAFDRNSLGFSDADRISPYADEAMHWAVKSGIVTGRSHKILAPESCASRAEVAAMLMRLLMWQAEGNI